MPNKFIKKDNTLFYFFLEMSNEDNDNKGGILKSRDTKSMEG